MFDFRNFNMYYILMHSQRRCPNHLLPGLLVSTRFIHLYRTMDAITAHEHITNEYCTSHR